MGIINRLPRNVYDKIAAGEVVERPESVIKELVENSIDAGADKICVEIKNGGSIYMKVQDNGSGMSADDAELAFIRHATSKISTEEDLEAISTMGFRGEALASIAAVSQVDLYTKRAEDESGTHVLCSGGEIRTVEDFATTDGTIFIVKNLFFNVPARMKFLKKDATEAAAVSNIMTRFILAHPEISFKFINNSKEKLFSPGDNILKNSVYSVYGKAYAKSSIDFDEEFNGIRVYGVLGRGETARPNREYQSCFVNKRYVISGVVAKAIDEAYKNQIMIGKYPMAVVNIDINPAMIDINVHPKKLEVKFSDSHLVYQAVYHAVKDALYSVADVPKIEIKEQTPIVPPKMEEEARRIEREFEKKSTPGGNVSVNEDRVSMIKAVKPSERVYQSSYNTDISDDYFAKKKEEFVRQRNAEILGFGLEKKTPETTPEPPKEHIQSAIPEPESVPAKEPEEKQETIEIAPQAQRTVRVVGQVFDTYIIVESEGEMLIIDQHAAHERIMYEKLKKSIAEKKVFSQVMLIPSVVNLSATEFAEYKEYKEKIADMGFETEEFGANSIVVRSTPYDFNSEDLEELIVNIINNFADNKNEVITEKQDRLLYTIACKAAIKANHTLSLAEQKSLAEKVLNFDNINTCPHGRPITISMTKKELEKNFKRIV